VAKRLHLAWIEQKEKRVHFIPGNRRSVTLTAAQEDCLCDIRKRIQAGHQLPPFCYRRDSSPDELLEREGIMHLHLSPTDRDEVVFLVQYDEHVVFLEVTNDAPFRDDPPGYYLAELHRRSLDTVEAQLDAEKAAELGAAKARVQEGLHRPKPRTT
jgi:hypothetical protein